MLYIHQLEDNLTQTRNGLKAQIQNLQRDNYKYKINNQKLKTKERQLKFAKDESDSQIQQLTQLTTNLENLFHSTELGGLVAS